MMPIACLLIKNSGGGGGGSVNFNNDSVFDNVVDPADASCNWVASSGGGVTGSGISGYTWLVSGVNSDYEIQATLVSGSMSSGTFGSWLPLSTTRSWVLNRTVIGIVNAIVDFECRRVSDSVVIASWTVNFEASVDA